MRTVFHQGAILGFVLLAASGSIQAAARTSASTSAKFEARPIVSTDFLYGTFDLIYDIHDSVYNALFKEFVDKALPEVTSFVDQFIEARCKSFGIKKENVYAAWTVEKGKLDVLKANVVAQLAFVHEKLNRVSSTAVQSVEKVVPRYAGLIPRTIGGLLLFGAYVTFILYTIFRVIKCVFCMWLSVVCFCCCCGMCRKSSTAKKTTKTKADNGKSKAGKSKK
eukprot:TRINITY_DN6481_c0_g1_i2.p1 TRINITY_DN6481_c0_g1~~TRINITY_DN6481_c0_g1_i2.p1  ORF type:complete len:222 (+),score=45.71 TRINITY_DN6481_c0_g1_i2:97-762(+)